MIKNVKNILFVAFMSLALPCIAESKNNYDIDYYENEGRLLFKIRAYGISSNGKHKNLPAPTVANPQPNGALVHNGFGLDTATGIFFNDNFAMELALGFGALRVKNLTLAQISNNYGNGNYLGKRRDIYIVPLTLTAQYHIAPFGGIRPYVGGGYHGSYLFSKSKAFKVSNGHGMVIQLGCDFVAKDDTLINFDIKQYFLSPKITYQTTIANTKMSSKIKLNPLMISAGIGFKL